MDELKDKSCIVFDYGYSIALARRLAREFGTVKYFRPWQETGPESSKLAIGDDFEDIVRIRRFWPEVDEADLIVFTDIYDGDLQDYLEDHGKRVWGSRMAERLEYDRPFFLQTLERIGLPVPGYKICHGITELAEYLQDPENENKWVKVNLRGDDETWHHINWNSTLSKIRALWHKHGTIGVGITYTVVDHLDSKVESAYDGFLITSPDGEPQFTDIGFMGYEDKNNSHILRAIPYDDFPDSLKTINETFAPEAAKFNFRCAFGTEVKEMEDGESFFIDFTARQPNPPGDIIAEQVSNLGEVMYEGAAGNVVPLKIEKEYGVQVDIYSSWSEGNECPIQYPRELERWVKVLNCIGSYEGSTVIPGEAPTVDPGGSQLVGCVVAIGDSIEEAIEKAGEYCEQVKGPYLENRFDTLAEVLRRIKEGEEMGIEFSDEAIPEPSTITDPE